MLLRFGEIDRASRENFTRKMTKRKSFEQRLQQVRGEAMGTSGVEALQAGGPARARALSSGTPGMCTAHRASLRQSRGDGGDGSRECRRGV